MDPTSEFPRGKVDSENKLNLVLVVIVILLSSILVLGFHILSVANSISVVVEDNVSTSMLAPQPVDNNFMGLLVDVKKDLVDINSSLNSIGDFLPALTFDRCNGNGGRWLVDPSGVIVIQDGEVDLGQGLVQKVRFSQCIFPLDEERAG